MAKKYWTNIIRDIFKEEVRGRTKTYRRLQGKSFKDESLNLRTFAKLDKTWTKAAIHASLSKVGINPNEYKEAVNQAVNAFHDEVIRKGSKLKTIEKVTQTGIAGKGRTIANSILPAARKKARETLQQAIQNLPEGEGTRELQFSHGEFGINKKGMQTPVTTTGTMKGLHLLNLLNSEKFAKAFEGQSGRGLEADKFLREAILIDLEEFYSKELYWDINLSATPGVKITDTYEVYAGIKKQELPLEYDFPFDKDKKIQKRINDKFQDTIEKTLRKNMGTYFKASKMESSSKNADRYKLALLKTVVNELDNIPGTRITSNVKELKDLSGKKKTPTISNKGRERLVKRKKVGKASSKKVKSQPTTTAVNVLKLKNLINAMLPEALLAQMELPRLRNRTGRFRSSAQVTDIRVGPRGGTEIDYTYQLNPYQTFEPGGMQGSVNRDPRALIGGTIREIAKELMGKKFIKTRRV